MATLSHFALVSMALHGRSVQWGCEVMVIQFPHRNWIKNSLGLESWGGSLLWARQMNGNSYRLLVLCGFFNAFNWTVDGSVKLSGDLSHWYPWPLPRLFTPEGTAVPISILFTWTPASGDSIRKLELSLEISSLQLILSPLSLYLSPILFHVHSFFSSTWN